MRLCRRRHLAACHGTEADHTAPKQPCRSGQWDRIDGQCHIVDLPAKRGIASNTIPIPAATESDLQRIPGVEGAEIGKARAEGCGLSRKDIKTVHVVRVSPVVVGLNRSGISVLGEAGAGHRGKGAAIEADQDLPAIPPLLEAVAMIKAEADGTAICKGDDRRRQQMFNRVSLAFFRSCSPSTAPKTGGMTRTSRTGHP